jgi:hypothetical protein
VAFFCGTGTKTNIAPILAINVLDDSPVLSNIVLKIDAVMA